MTDPRIWQAQIDEARQTMSDFAQGGYVGSHAMPDLNRCANVIRKVKPRWRLVTTTALYYHFVNLRTTGLSREYYTIRRSDFWGRVR